MDSRYSSGPALRAQLDALDVVERDGFVDALLGFTELPDDGPLPAGAVPYLPCGVDEILAAVDGVPIGAADVVVDVGSGLGRVLLLAHLLTGCRGVGIELQRHLVDAARVRCAGVDAIEFVEGDAADVDVDGSVFFFYAPCNGPLLARVLARVERVARRHPIVVCAVGMVLDVAWLRPRPTSHLTLRLYDSSDR